MPLSPLTQHPHSRQPRPRRGGSRRRGQRQQEPRIENRTHQEQSTQNPPRRTSPSTFQHSFMESPSPSFEPEPTVDFMDDVHVQVDTITRPKAPSRPSGAARIVSDKYIASYDWRDTFEPTIVVPGSPRVWKEPIEFPHPLLPHPDRHHNNQNTHYLPHHPLVPIFDAVDELKASIHWPDIDFVLDHTVLMQIFDWARGDTKLFRIDLELASRSTVLVHDWRGHGAGVPPESTLREDLTICTTRPARGCQESTGHFRVISYDFFGMRFIVRHKIDACLPKAGKTGLTPYECGSTPFDLTEMFWEISDTDLWGLPEAEPQTSERVIRSGKEIPQKSLIQVAACPKEIVGDIDWTAILSSAYLAAMPWLYVGVVQNNQIQDVRMIQMATPEIRKRIDERAGIALELVGQVLECIHDIITGHSVRSQLSLVGVDGVLKVFRKTGCSPFLPEKIYARFADEST